MTLAGIYFRQFTMAQYTDFAFRLLIAFFIGGTIGIERSNHFKEAGVRTHILVCVTAALIMLISKYGFVDGRISSCAEIIKSERTLFFIYTDCFFQQGYSSSYQPLPEVLLFLPRYPGRLSSR